MEPKKGTAAKTYKVRLSNNASGNIDEIAKYIAIANNEPINAINVVDKIFETIDRIADHPFAFRECNEIPTKSRMYRRAVCFSWLIVYKIIEQEIIILGIINSAMKPSRIKALRKIR